MKIRLLTENDIPQCLNLFYLNYESGKYSRIENELNAMFEEHVWIRPQYYVVEYEEKVVAFGGYSVAPINANCYEIYWINVHPDYKKKGIGRKIVTTIIKTIKNTGNSKAWITLTCKYHLEHFYKSFGFYIIMETPAKDGYMMALTKF